MAPSSDFALKQLQKYGWAPGQGLGLNNQGMAEPLQLGLKLNQKGLGKEELEKKKSGWGNQWWDSIFNKTLKSLDVSSGGGGGSNEEVCNFIEFRDDCCSELTKDKRR
jgi:hypothetical protein